MTDVDQPASNRRSHRLAPSRRSTSSIWRAANGRRCSAAEQSRTQSGEREPADRREQREQHDQGEGPKFRVVPQVLVRPHLQLDEAELTGLRESGTRVPGDRQAAVRAHLQRHQRVRVLLRPGRLRQESHDHGHQRQQRPHTAIRP